MLQIRANVNVQLELQRASVIWSEHAVQRQTPEFKRITHLIHTPHTSHTQLIHHSHLTHSRHSFSSCWRWLFCFFSVMTRDLNEMFFIFTALLSTSALNDSVRSSLLFISSCDVSCPQNVIKCPLLFIFSALFKYTPPHTPLSLTDRALLIDLGISGSSSVFSETL